MQNYVHVNNFNHFMVLFVLESADCCSFNALNIIICYSLYHRQNLLCTITCNSRTRFTFFLHPKEIFRRFFDDERIMINDFRFAAKRRTNTYQMTMN